MTHRAAKFRARWHCHRSWLCCQYCDLPDCNSPSDGHRFARWLRAWTRTD